MNIFNLRDRVINDYHQYIESFLNIQDEKIRQFVNEELSSGILWPDPLIQLNPSYEMGKTVSQLVKDGVLHPLCEKIFQKDGKSFHLYHHQEQAIHIAAKKEHYVLTTGTGSGKSLTYLIPIIDHILKNNPEPEQTRALIVYPMNALINSQEKEIKRLLDNLGEGNSPIRFGRYTGQEKEEDKTQLQQHPPHILLTNYVMLELMMSRPREFVFLDHTLANLEFLVLDELHTYTGRQGADVSMLVRRVRQRCGNDNLLCIGTSATMVTGGTRDEQRNAVAYVAGKIFGATVLPENVIDERLKKTIQYSGDFSQQKLVESLERDIPQNYSEFINNPLTAWIEETFGIEKVDNFYVRRSPITLQEGAEKLHNLTNIDDQTCEERIKKLLHMGSQLRHPDNTPVFAVRLHQFISKGDSIYATIESIDKRYLTLIGQHFTKGDNGKDRLLVPLVFCRICGQEYYQVTRKETDKTVEPQVPDDTPDIDQESAADGYLIIEREDNPFWSEERINELPEHWFRQTKKGPVLDSKYKEYVPQRMYVAADGTYSDEPSEGKVLAWFLKAPLLTCLSCSIAYDKRPSEFSKLARLSVGGRSSATTIVCLSQLTQMQHITELEPEARKILSFTDNRQDASLQAGHFNDFIQIGFLRSAIYRALKDNKVLDHSTVASEVFKALALPATEYAQNPGEIGIQPQLNRGALIEYIEYRIYQDLRRGWRVVQPNLEQCGLLKIEYLGLDKLCSNSVLWSKNDVLSNSGSETRFKVAKAFLDHLRHSLSMNARCLKGEYHQILIRKVNDTLKEPWNFDDDERLLESKWFAWGTRRPKDSSLALTSVIGKYLRSSRAWPQLSLPLNESEYEQLLRILADVLNQAGYLDKEQKGDDFRVQLRIPLVQWVKGEGTVQPLDPVRSLRLSGNTEESLVRKANPFFVKFYQEGAQHLIKLEGREHTGQTNPEEREKREKRFREGDLSCLFCSPTMELGIDIADLNTVNMRNVPPTPANYAQRSGRAGRSGQPAFISTYCSTGSGHDQYFFRRRTAMVAGIVVPPRLDLANEDLVKSHVHAVWLALVGLNLKNTITEIIDLSQKDLPLVENVAHQINLSKNKIGICLENCRSVLKQCEEYLNAADWYSDEWLEATVKASAREFNESFDRWRELYRVAYRQLIESQEKLTTAHITGLKAEERQKADRNAKEAMHQIDLLCNRVNRDDSDFYPYRYLASEGFLPGYNFPRLPVRAYISKGIAQGDFISRPRFLAVYEFGPRNIIYQEGRKYSVVKSFLPIGDPESRFIQAKTCSVCGTFHTGDSVNADLCGHCQTTLNANNCEFLPKLFEMTTVSTWRTERITCDEEERIRKGYEITTHFRFASKDGKVSKVSAEVMDSNGKSLLKLSYGPAAHLWRINRRWRRRGTQGFTLDLSNGVWDRRPGDIADSALTAGQENIRSGVQILVRDTRNILLIQSTLENNLSEDQLANLQHALQKGICAVYQIDEKEIASERIGQGEKRSILYWEVSEGGVGVLQRLVEDSDAISHVAREALEICHFDRETGDEVLADIDCARACYDCLLTYRNQRDHIILDRHLVKDILIAISEGKTQRTYEHRTYDEQFEWLRQRVDKRSQLEKDFLDHLYKEGRRLPDFTQKPLPNYYSIPDFYYEDGYICIFCDGTPHDEKEQKEKDDKDRANLRNMGYRVVVIRYDRTIPEQIEEHKDIFGVVRK